MKKIRFVVLLVSVMAISLGLASCGEMATLRIENDTEVAQTFWLSFDGGALEENARTMAPGGTTTINRSNGFTVEFWSHWLLIWSNYRTSVVPGDTVTVRLSDVF